jgi:hypothetical protein
MARILLGRVSGYSAYETWAHLPENAGKTEEDFFAFLTSTVPGPPGPQGDVGPDGKSAYELWLDAGNLGSRDDFLSSLRVFASIKKETDTEYVLSINYGNLSFDTPNLKGSDALGDVVIADSLSEFPQIGEGQTLYVALDSCSTYSWGEGSFNLMGSLDFDSLKNKPAIDGVVLDSESSSEGLGLVKSEEFGKHLEDSSNPHEVTKAQIGLGNANNTSDEDKPVSTEQQAALDEKVNKVDGKGLSTNDFTDEYEQKLNGVGDDISASAVVSGSLDISTIESSRILLVKGDGSAVSISLEDLAYLLVGQSAIGDNGSTFVRNFNRGGGFTAYSEVLDSNSYASVFTNSHEGDPVGVGLSLAHYTDEGEEGDGEGDSEEGDGEGDSEDEVLTGGVHILLMNDGVSKSAYLLKNKEVPIERDQVSPSDEMLNRGEVDVAINNIVASAISGVLPVPVILEKESSLPDISGGSEAVQYFVIEEMDVTSPSTVRQGRAWCGVGEASWHVLLDLVNALSTDVFKQKSDGEWVLAEGVQALIDGAVQGSQILTSEPTASATDSQVVSGKRIRSMFGAALSTLKTTAKTVVAAINELFDSIGAKQNALTATGTSNVLTAPASAGGQPGTKELSNFITRNDATLSIPNGSAYTSFSEYIQSSDCPKFGAYTISGTLGWPDSPWGTSGNWRIFFITPNMFLGFPTSLSSTSSPFTTSVGIFLGCRNSEGITWSRNPLEDSLSFSNKTSLKELSATWNETAYTTLAEYLAARLAATPVNMGKSGSYVSGRYYLSHSNFTDLPVNPSQNANRWIIDINRASSYAGIMLRPMQTNGSAMYLGYFSGTAITWRAIPIPTQAQTDALNSGITKELVGLIGGGGSGGSGGSGVEGAPWEYVDSDWPPSDTLVVEKDFVRKDGESSGYEVQVVLASDFSGYRLRLDFSGYDKLLTFSVSGTVTYVRRGSLEGNRSTVVEAFLSDFDVSTNSGSIDIVPVYWGLDPLFLSGDARIFDAEGHNYRLEFSLTSLDINSGASSRVKLGARLYEE